MKNYGKRSVALQPKADIKNKCFYSSLKIEEFHSSGFDDLWFFHNLGSSLLSLFVWLKSKSITDVVSFHIEPFHFKWGKLCLTQNCLFKLTDKNLTQIDIDLWKETFNMLVRADSYKRKRKRKRYVARKRCIINHLNVRRAKDIMTCHHWEEKCRRGNESPSKPLATWLFDLSFIWTYS